MYKKIISITLSLGIAVSAVFGLSIPQNTAPASAATFTTVSPYTGKTYYHDSKFQGLNIYHGVDVSVYNGTIDWAKVKADGIDYAFIRASYRGYGSAGTLCTDAKFETNIKGALAAGVKVGVYYWSEAINKAEAIEEANFILNQIKDYDITMPVVLDWEYMAGNIGRMYTAHLSKAQVTTNVEAFCQTVAASGYTPMIYANRSDLLNSMDSATLSESYPIWIARYNTQVSTTSLPFTGKYEYWQYASTGVVNGLTEEGNAQSSDVNFWYTSKKISDLKPQGPNNPASTSAPDATATPVTKLDASKGLATASASKAITLTWESVANAGGYEIYRRDTYDGSYQKVKTISSGTTTTWKNSGLSKKHEYSYKLRAYAKTTEDTIYSSYTVATAPTRSKAQTGKTKKAYTLTKAPGTSTARVKVSKNTDLAILGVTYVEDGKSYLHVQYQTKKKNYDGYLPSNASLTYCSAGVVTSDVLNMRKTATSSAKLLVAIPNGSYLPLLSKKKGKDGSIWYKTSFASKKGTVKSGYVHSGYLTKK